MTFRVRRSSPATLGRIALGVALGLCGSILASAQTAPAPAPAPAPLPAGAPPPSAPLAADQLQELVAPIALYPDSLVAQILAAATYPTQIVEAERFLEQNPKLKDKKLAKEVDKQDWAPSVKALTAFPSVLSDMNQNLSWTSELGDANFNQPQDVMNAIQFMRRQAQQAGNLNNTPQETVNNVNGDVQIMPADPDVVYVPVYDPEDVFGYPVGLWPGFYPWWTMGGPYMSFGIGIGMGPFYGFGWGWPHWGLGWGPQPGIWFGGNRWYSQTHAFYDRQAFLHGNYQGYGGRGFVSGGTRGGSFASGRARGNTGFRGGSIGANRSLRGLGTRATPGVRSGAFGGFGRGGDVRAFSSRGFSSMGGGFRGGFGGGGMRMGGGMAGGGRR